MENQIIQNLQFFEGATLVSALIKAMEYKENARKIIKILFDRTKIRSKGRQLSFFNAKARELGFEVCLVSKEEINACATGSTHGGILAVCSPVEFPKLSPELVKKDGIYYIFDGIEDPYNFGYMIRSVYAAGADGIIVSDRNWFEAATTVAKSSAGTSELIDIFISEPENALNVMKSIGYCVASAGIRNSESVYETELKKPLLVIIGGEKRGISGKLLEKSDKVIRIDYGREFKGSLPSVAATSVIAFEILRKTTEN